MMTFFSSTSLMAQNQIQNEGDLDNDPPYLEAEPDGADIRCVEEILNFQEVDQFIESNERIANRVATGDVWRFYERFKRQGVPDAPLKLALEYFEKNRSTFENQNYISIADYSQNSRERRFYMLDMRTGEVLKEQVSHGSGKVNGVNHGDPDHDGMLDRCVHSNGSTRNMTRPGFFKTHVPYRSSQSFPLVGRHKNMQYNGMRLIGLEARNRDALERGVVMHEANYNRKGAQMGRSFGCPAFAPGVAKNIFPNIMLGSLFYAHAPQCE